MLQPEAQLGPESGAKFVALLRRNIEFYRVKAIQKAELSDFKPETKNLFCIKRLIKKAGIDVGKLCQF